MFFHYRESVHFLNFRSVAINGKRCIYVEKDRLWDWINILPSGTLLNCTKRYKNLPLKFQALKRSFSLLRRTKCFASIIALVFNSLVCEFIQQGLGTDVEGGLGSASSVPLVAGIDHIAPTPFITCTSREKPCKARSVRVKCTSQGGRGRCVFV